MPTGQESDAVPTGYAHPSYARALAEYGTPRELPRCGGWILQRPVPDTEVVDAMGCYPLFSCRDWSDLGTDLDEIGDDLVSLALVADPFGDYSLERLNTCFDIVKPFKEHVVVDLARPRNEMVTKHHRKTARRALKRLVVEKCESPQDYLEDWVRLYGHLASTRGVTGMAAFSRESLSRQLEVPGASFFVAIYEHSVVGAALSYLQHDVAYAHLTAFDETGYNLGASYAIKWVQMDYYCDRARWLNLGGVPGVADEGSEGLRWYKQGWSPERRTAYFCGRIFNAEEYARLTSDVDAADDGYFPAYRAGTSPS